MHVFWVGNNLKFAWECGEQDRKSDFGWIKRKAKRRSVCSKHTISIFSSSLCIYNFNSFLYTKQRSKESPLLAPPHSALLSLASFNLFFAYSSAKSTWHPIMTADTTTQSYWLSWRVLLCAIWILFSAIFSILLIWKYEVLRKPVKNGNNMEARKETSPTLYEDETWMPCLKGIHPVWLLAFRVFAFIVLLVLLIATATTDGGRIFYCYTEWTFTSVIIYFGLGSLLFIHGCYQHHKKAGGDKVDNVDGDTEQGTCGCVAPSLPQSYNPSNHDKGLGAPEEHLVRKPAGTWGYIFQIIFQMNAGAVMLTDCVFWFIFAPFLTIKDYNINFLIINMHTINAVFLLGDTALNCLRFPWFRIGYFCLWTTTYVIFQWIVHAFVKLWWPYPFLDLSSRYAPLWYLTVALLHIPCYGIFALIMKLKHTLLSTRYPDSYRCVP